MIIRPATSADIPAITRIYAHAVENGTASFEIAPPDDAEMGRRFDELAAKNFPYIVAEDNGALAGYAYAGPYRARLAYRYTVEDTVYIAPDRQRRGVGKLLLTALAGEAEQRGFRQMLAVIGDSPAQAASVALHKACGFEIVGKLPDVGFKKGRWLDSLLMQRALGAGSSSPPPA